jgi:DNA-binding YbaB/EbfC family protein
MFGDLGSVMKMMGNLGKIKEEMARFQDQAGQLTAEAVVGGGLVTVRMNGKFEMVACQISDDALKDRELLEDLIVSATTQAVGKVRELLMAEMSKTAAGLGLPPGMMGQITGLNG